MAYIPYYVPEQLQDNISYFAYLMSVEHIKNLHSWRWYFVVLRIIYKHKIRVVAPMYLELSYMVILITYLSLIPTHIFDPRSPFPFLSSVQPVFLLIFFPNAFFKKKLFCNLSSRERSIVANCLDKHLKFQCSDFFINEHFWHMR